MVSLKNTQVVDICWMFKIFGLSQEWLRVQRILSLS